MVQGKGSTGPNAFDLAVSGPFGGFRDKKARSRVPLRPQGDQSAFDVIFGSCRSLGDQRGVSEGHISQATSDRALRGSHGRSERDDGLQGVPIQVAVSLGRVFRDFDQRADCFLDLRSLETKPQRFEFFGTR